MQLDVYVNYPGHCEAALRFYEKHLGGQITGIMYHREMPGPSDGPPGWADKVVHARIEIGGTVLMAADIPDAQPMRSAYLTLTLDTPEDADRVYALLQEGGDVFMPMESTFYAERFAMLRDRFGTSWMLLCEREDAAGNE